VLIAAAAARIPAWRAEPGTWLLVAAFGAGYAIAIVRLGPRFTTAGQRAVTRLQVTSWCCGLLALWVAADWPIHDIAEQSTYSVHMVQHLLLSMVAPPLLLLGTPAWLLRWLLGPPSRRFQVVRRLARFLPALIIFNVVIVLIHWPAVVDASLHNGGLHFLVHALIFVTSFLVWLPVLSPLPEIPRLAPVSRMAFLFLQSIVPTLPASFLTFGTTVLYHYYAHRANIWGLSSLQDQQVAGLIMKIGAGILLWSVIAVTFFRWAAEEERTQHPRARREREAELSALGR
jgi:putative membrane protein